jgi:hypothetical protein
MSGKHRTATEDNIVESGDITSGRTKVSDMAVSQRMMSPETQNADPGSAFADVRSSQADAPDCKPVRPVLCGRQEFPYPHSDLFEFADCKSALLPFDRWLISGTVRQSIRMAQIWPIVV